MNQGLFWCIMAAGLAAVILAIDGCLELAKRRERRLEPPLVIRLTPGGSCLEAFERAYLEARVSRRTLAPPLPADTERQILAAFAVPREMLEPDPAGPNRTAAEFRVTPIMAERKRLVVKFDPGGLEPEVPTPDVASHRLYRGRAGEACLVCGEPEWKHTGAEA